MGTLENEETRNENGPRRSSLNADSSDVATQKIDSQFSPGNLFPALSFIACILLNR